MQKFNADIGVIVGNPFVLLPAHILERLFIVHGKDKGPIPVRGTVNGKEFQQTLVRYSGEWRLYINMKMLRRSPERIGENIAVSIEYDPSDRSIATPVELIEALDGAPRAKAKFNALTPSLQKEIVRYIAELKKEESRLRSAERAVRFLLGKDTFVGRRPL